MAIHVAGEKIKDGHVHEVIQPPAVVVGRNIPDLSGRGMVKKGKSNAKLSCSSRPAMS